MYYSYTLSLNVLIVVYFKVCIVDCQLIIFILNMQDHKFIVLGFFFSSLHIYIYLNLSDEYILNLFQGKFSILMADI